MLHVVCVQLPYLDAVFNEALRVSPPAAFGECTRAGMHCKQAMCCTRATSPGARSGCDGTCNMVQAPSGSPGRT
jgi:hypothetical protein